MSIGHTSIKTKDALEVLNEDAVDWVVRTEMLRIINGIGCEDKKIVKAAKKIHNYFACPGDQL